MAETQRLHRTFCPFSAHLPHQTRGVQRVYRARQLCKASLLDPTTLLCSSSAPTALAFPTPPLASLALNAHVANLPNLFQTINAMDDAVASQLTGLTPLSFLIVLSAGLVTSLSPCTLSVLPLTIGYIGGFSSGEASPSTAPLQRQETAALLTDEQSTNDAAEATTITTTPAPSTTARAVTEPQDDGSNKAPITQSNNETFTTPSPPPPSTGGTPQPIQVPHQQDIQNQTQNQPQPSSSAPAIIRAGSFAAGLATTFACLGMASSFLGGAYGQIGDAAPILASAVAVLMGLNLLEVVQLRLPSLDVDTRALELPPALSAYLAGLTFALAASPCSTPILATLLAYVSTTKDPAAGAGLLFAYSLGYVAPLLAAGLFAGALKDILAVRRWSGWVTPASGVLLLAGGTYGLLSRLVPA